MQSAWPVALSVHWHIPGLVDGGYFYGFNAEMTLLTPMPSLEATLVKPNLVLSWSVLLILESKARRIAQDLGITSTRRSPLPTADRRRQFRLRTLWQTLETKARFIAQVMNGESDLRRIEDIDGAALTYAEVKGIASGNPMVIEKANVDAEVARLARLRSQHIETQFRLRTQIRHLNEEVPRLEKRSEEVHFDIAARHDTHGDAFVIQIDGQVIRDRGIAGELVLRHAERVRATQTGRLLGQFAGFQIFVAHNFMSGADIVLKGAGTHVAKAGSTAMGTIRSVEYVIQNLDETAATAEQGIRETRERISDRSNSPRRLIMRRDSHCCPSDKDKIEQALDLTKGQASAQLDSREIEDTEETASAIQPSQSADGISRGKALEGVCV